MQKRFLTWDKTPSDVQLDFLRGALEGDMEPLEVGYSSCRLVRLLPTRRTWPACRAAGDGTLDLGFSVLAGPHLEKSVYHGLSKTCPWLCFFCFGHYARMFEAA